MATSTQAQRIPKLGNDEAKDYVKSMSLTQRALRRILRDRLTMTAIIVLAILSFLTIFGPTITQLMGINPNATNGYYRMLRVGATVTIPAVPEMPAIQESGVKPVTAFNYLLGTDNLGRDQFARLLHAGRVSLGIGFFGAIISLTVGMALGIITGFFGGVVDDILNWIITTLDSIPSLYLLIMISAIFVSTAEVLIFVIALTSWTGITRIIRGQTLQIRNLDYVLSARALGSSVWRIMFVHIAPNLISITVIVLMRAIGNLMLAEAALSFLGFGVQVPQATWGNMLTKAQEFVRAGGMHLIWPPGICIWVTVLCLYIIGDGVRDAYDPTSTK